MTPTGTPAWTIAKEPWTGVPDSQIKQTMVGSQVRKTFATATQHRIVTVLQIGKSSDGNTALDSASLITSAGDSIGACALSSCFLTAADHAATARPALTYTTPATMAANSRQLVADMDSDGCYQVTSSVSGTVATGLTVSADDHTLQYVVPTAGAQDLSIAKGDCTASDSGSASGCSCRFSSRGANSAASVAVISLSLLALGYALLRGRRKQTGQAR